MFTADHFQDVQKLRLEPHFADYMSEAFKPLGVYLKFFQPTLAGGTEVPFTVKMVNDEPRPIEGTLLLTLERPGGERLALASRSFRLATLGDAMFEVRLTIPNTQPLRATSQKRSRRINILFSRRTVTGRATANSACSTSIAVWRNGPTRAGGRRSMAELSACSPTRKSPVGKATNLDPPIRPG